MSVHGYCLHSGASEVGRPVDERLWILSSGASEVGAPVGERPWILSLVLPLIVSVYGVASVARVA